MANETMRADLYVPEVWGDMAHAEFLKRAIIGTSTAVVTDNELVGKPGESVTFPKWETLGDLDDLTEGVAMTTETMGQSSTQAKIKEAGKAVEITDTASLTGIGNPQDEAIRQFGILAARKIDADLITAALRVDANGKKTPKNSSGTEIKPLQATITGGKITWGGLVDAIEQFGDDFEPDEFTGLFIRSKQRSQIMKDDDFIKASELSASGQGSLVARGVIGAIAGLPVYVTDRLPENKAVVLRRSSLGLKYKRRPIVERDRDILKRTTVVTTHMHYAVHRISDRGVLEVTISG